MIPHDGPGNPSPDSPNPRYVAYHEAGHAVIGHQHGFTILDASITPDPDGSGGSVRWMELQDDPLVIPVEEETRKVVKDPIVWRAVEALADVFRRELTITGTKAREIIASAVQVPLGHPESRGEEPII